VTWQVFFNEGSPSQKGGCPREGGKMATERHWLPPGAAEMAVYAFQSSGLVDIHERAAGIDGIDGGIGF